MSCELQAVVDSGGGQANCPVTKSNPILGGTEYELNATHRSFDLSMRIKKKNNEW